MFPELRCLQSVYVSTSEARGAESKVVRGYGIAHTGCDADAEPDTRVTVEMWVPEGCPGLGWATIGDRTYWCGDDEGEDEWELAGLSPAIVTVPRRDVRTIDEVGEEMGPDDPCPMREVAA